MKVYNGNGIKFLYNDVYMLGMMHVYVVLPTTGSAFQYRDDTDEQRMQDHGGITFHCA
jgi:hypothetical protein